LLECGVLSGHTTFPRPYVHRRGGFRDRNSAYNHINLIKNFIQLIEHNIIHFERDMSKKIWENRIRV